MHHPHSVIEAGTFSRVCAMQYGVAHPWVSCLFFGTGPFSSSNHARRAERVAHGRLPSTGILMSGVFVARQIHPVHTTQSPSRRVLRAIRSLSDAIDMVRTHSRAQMWLQNFPRLGSLKRLSLTRNSVPHWAHLAKNWARSACSRSCSSAWQLAQSSTNRLGCAATSFSEADPGRSQLSLSVASAW